LCKVVSEITSGLIQADLGGGVYKQRVGRPGQGKSGGFRTILFFRAHKRILFVFGYAKKDKANLDTNELKALRELAKEFLEYDEANITTLLKTGALSEIFCEEPV
jgi:hypothetical protein